MRKYAFVAKNSEGDLGSALCDETWINLSTSYLATASAIRSVPSMCTSDKLKFLHTRFSFVQATSKASVHSPRRLIRCEAADAYLVG